jgi:hypothetical protein
MHGVEPTPMITSASGTFGTCRGGLIMSVVRGIVLQKPKVALVRITGGTLERAAIDDSYNLSRATEVAYEFSVRR